ncbi:MAG: AI-2E family transporter, partial [Woeseiaceae bacterium]|nr:AI-2E family transporter [Woeseiaceae bacterium]
WLLADSTFDRVQQTGAQMRSGSITISPPDASVAEWPIIGDKVHAIWTEAANDLENTLNEYGPQLRALGSKAVGFAASTAGTVLQFIFSIIIGAVLLMSAQGGHATTRNILTGLAGPETGEKLTTMTILTIRSVVKGVLGVAIIQTIFAAIGLAVAGIPFAGIWALAVLVLAIVQLPPIIVLGPIAFWYFSVADGTPATIFLVYSIIVSVSDTFLKPMLLGRGVETPMLVILIGAIGGAITSGIIGLFIGAVVLAIGYELLVTWMRPDATEAPPGTPAEA